MEENEFEQDSKRFLEFKQLVQSGEKSPNMHTYESREIWKFRYDDDDNRS